jgi:hypothetical protein
MSAGKVTEPNQSPPLWLRMNASLPTRDRLHPLNHLQRHALTRAILPAIDVPALGGSLGVSWNVTFRERRLDDVSSARDH